MERPVEIPPFASDMVIIDDYEDAAALLRQPQVSTIWSGDTGGRDPEFVRDGLIALDGAEHLERRRLESQLFSAARLAEYERGTLEKLLDGFFAEARSSRGADGVVALDLVTFALSMLVRIGASIAGVDGVDTIERAERLLEFSDATSHATNVHWARTDAAEKERVMAHGREMRALFVDEFLAASIERRAALVAEVAAGARPVEELPRDIITLLLSHSREDWKGDLLVREVLIYLHASIRTSTRALCNTAQELFEWLREHPEDKVRAQDTAFLADVVDETLRLRSIIPLLLRQTSEDVKLPSGKVIAKDQHVAIVHTLANRDRDRFGPDAEEFRPGRAPLERSVQTTGLAFGLGTHMCIGKRVAVGGPGGRDGGEPTIGTIPMILQRLMAAGMELDPDRPPVPNTTSYYDEFSSFPVRLLRI